MPKIHYDPSPDRQRLSELSRELSTIIRAFCSETPAVRGKFVTLRRRCGKSPCHCTTGDLHETKAFVDRSAAERRIYSATSEVCARLRKPVSEYRKLRSLRIRLRSLGRELLPVCDRLRDYRLQRGAEIAQRFKE
jgi:hypothetical protein